jgi:hypothetical protein
MCVQAASSVSYTRTFAATFAYACWQMVGRAGDRVPCIRCYVVLLDVYTRFMVQNPYISWRMPRWPAHVLGLCSLLTWQISLSVRDARACMLPYCNIVDHAVTNHQECTVSHTSPVYPCARSKSLEETCQHSGHGSSGCMMQHCDRRRKDLQASDTRNTVSHILLSSGATVWARLQAMHDNARNTSRQ